MVMGAATVASLWILADWFLLRPWVAVLDPLDNLVFPLWWPALFAVAVLAWLQALMWHGFGLPWLRVLSFYGAVADRRFQRFLQLSNAFRSVLCGLFAGILGLKLGNRVPRRAPRPPRGYAGLDLALQLARRAVRWLS